MSDDGLPPSPPPPPPVPSGVELTGGPLPPLGGVFGKPVHFLGYVVGRRPGFTACFADGSTRFIISTTPEQVVRTMITRNGGERAGAD